MVKLDLLAGLFSLGDQGVRVLYELRVFDRCPLGSTKIILAPARNPLVNTCTSSQSVVELVT